ncbi:uncharacterized protein LOC111920723 [Lactuca sativa]|uniref:uncharacterized protein LOC111920723 n=1 Tax=Lactuca sativa TaxID=4236 RepID=UPI000CD8E261|nr:uncharacterized protein LOC111920723 [Lactuca sativa]
MLLFDESQTAIDSESTAKDNKVDSLKHIVDDAAQKMAADQPKATERPNVSEPLNDHPNVQGEGPVLQHDQDSSFQGENLPSQSSSSTESPNEGEDTHPDSEQASSFEGENTNIWTMGQSSGNNWSKACILPQDTQKSNVAESEYVPPKHKSAPPSESESESSDDEASGRGDTPLRSPTLEIPVHSLPPSLPPVTIPLSIPPIFPIPTSQPSTTIPIPTPIFTDTTTTTTTIGAHSKAPTSPVTTEPPLTTKPPITTKPLSPTPSTDTTAVLGGEDLEFDSTYFSPYRVQSDEDIDEPVTKRHLKAVNDKLDQLLSSSSSGTYSDVALKALFSFIVQEHRASHTNAAKAIDASISQYQKASLAVETSTKECKEATAKVDKLVSEAILFLDSLQAATQKNSQTVNASVDNLQRSLQAERSKLESAR